MASDATSLFPSRRSPVRYLAILLLLVAAAGVFFWFKGASGAAAGAQGEKKEEQAAAAAAPVEVTVEPVAASTLTEPLRVTGTLKTDETVTLSTKATGMVEHVYVKEGDRVKRGQLLVVIDDSDIRAQRDRAVAAVSAGQAQLATAQAQVRTAQAKLAQARTGKGIKDAAAQAEFRRAEEALATAKTRLSQAKSLSGITNTESETRVSSARAALQSARERLKILQEGSRRQEKASAEAAVGRARAQVALMKSMLERRQQLLQEKAIAREQVDAAQRDYEVAVTDLEAARQQLSLVQEGPRGEEIRVAEEAVRQSEAALRDAEANQARRSIGNEDVEAAEATVRQAEAALESARANLAQEQVTEDDIRSAEAAVSSAQASVAQARAAIRQAQADVRFQDQLSEQTRIYSPVNGVVTKRQVQTGAAVVQMRNELLTLVSADTLYFEATAPETALPQLRAGLPAQVMLDSVPGKTFPGVLREIIAVAEGTNRSVRLRISFKRPAESATVVGGFARAMIRGSSSTPTLSVPRTALTSDDGQFAVFVVEDGRAVRRPVMVGDAGGVGERVAIQEGLNGGEQVVVEGAASLVDGQEVTAKS
ncbi:MAG: efflux RND transporter periplasmic adaptor subunit [Armatimonadota bacterium]